jgi:hypothetical protein
MRHLLTVFCLAVSGVCVSASPDITISVAKLSALQEAKVSPVALRAEPEPLRPEARRPMSALSKANDSEPGTIASRSSDKIDPAPLAAPAPASKSDSTAGVSREEFCTLLMSAAADHTLPVGFFVNLIWQESRFVRNAVSSAGALGVAQFMPAVAESVGLRDPFDPRQALPASARLLRTLHAQFGNLGLAAAAYNAGPKRVLDWLARKGQLPQETRNYVLTITGRPAEHWMTNPPPPIAFRVPQRVPCFQVEAFAAAVKPADAPPPRETTAEMKVAERKALNLARATKRSIEQAEARAAFKKARIEAAVAKRTGSVKPIKEAARRSIEPAKAIKEAARRSNEPAKATKEAARRSKEPAKATKEAALRGKEPAKAKEAAKSVKEQAKSAKEPARPTREAALRGSSKTVQR